MAVVDVQEILLTTDKAALQSDESLELNWKQKQMIISIFLNFYPGSYNIDCNKPLIIYNKLINRLPCW